MPPIDGAGHLNHGAPALRKVRPPIRRAGSGRRAAAAAVLVIAAAPPGAALADEIWPPDAKPVRSLSELRNSGVVRQHWDLTCGAAAIATLMTYQLGRPVTERQVTLDMLRRTSPLLVRMRLGFSLYDLKRYAASQGFEAAGYGGLGLDDVVGMAPDIVPLRTHGFSHFVVLRGRSGDHLLLADPAFGNRTMSLPAFEAQWANHLGFAVVDPKAPHPPNRMGAPDRLFLTPTDQALRMAAGAIEVRPRP